MMYFLTYLDAFFPYMGIFSTEDSAKNYIEKFGGNNKNNYSIVRVEINDSLSNTVVAHSPHNKYVGTGR